VAIGDVRDKLTFSLNLPTMSFNRKISAACGPEIVNHQVSSVPPKARSLKTRGRNFDFDVRVRVLYRFATLKLAAGCKSARCSRGLFV